MISKLAKLAVTIFAVALFCALAPLNRASAAEQAVIVHFRYGSTDLHRLFAVEYKLETAIKDSKAGKYDGNEIATDGSDGFLYMYGPSADRLFEVVMPVLKTTDFMRGAEVTRQYGPPGDKSRKVTVTITP